MKINEHIHNDINFKQLKRKISQLKKNLLEEKGKKRLLKLLMMKTRMKMLWKIRK